MITAAHTIIYSRDAEATRVFFRDTLKLPFADAGHGWLIFALPPGELGIHPADAHQTGNRHELSFMCDDIEATIAELRAKGVEFTGEIASQGWGQVIAMKIPGGGEISLYQPRHASPLTTAKPS